MVLISESKRFEMTPTSMRPTETALRLLREVGLPEDDAVKAFCALGGFIVGFVMFEIGVTHASGPMDAPPTPEGSWPRSLPTSSLLHGLAAVPDAGDLDERFEYGLDLLIAGIRSKSAGLPISSVAD